MSAPATRRALALLAGVLLALCALLALDFLLPAPRAPLIAPLREATGAFREGLFRADRDAGYALAPGYRSSAGHAGAYALDAWPWRGRPGDPAPADVARVVVIGDSCVFGVGLDVWDTLPERLARALDARGLDPTRVLVLNLGVPGYSIVQCERVLARALDELRPAACVLYVAAWNDQAPAAGAADVEALAPRGPLARSSLAAFVAGLARGAEPDAAGPRVAAGEVEPRLAAMLAAARAAGCAPLVVAPAHPAATERANPRVAQDRDAVRRAARAAGAPLFDAHAIAQATPLEPAARDAALFVDFVHPSPLLWEAVVPELADALARALAAAVEPEAPRSALAIRGVEPAVVPSLGDARVVVALDGWQDGDPPPAISVGGAVLLDARALGRGRVEGVLPKNAPGVHDVIAQDARGVAVARGALRLAPPRLERAADGALVCVARPGDRAAVVLARRRSAAPIYSLAGAGLLDPRALIQPPYLVELGAGGRATIALPAASTGLFAQALVVPRGEPDDGREKRLTAAIEL